MSDIDICLNCTQPKCNGNYPHCNETHKNRRSKLRKLGRGNGTVLICLLAKLELKRDEIASICDITQSDVCKLLQEGLRRELITKDEIDATRRSRKKNGQYGKATV